MIHLIFCGEFVYQVLLNKLKNEYSIYETSGISPESLQQTMLIPPPVTILVRQSTPFKRGDFNVKWKIRSTMSFHFGGLPMKNKGTLFPFKELPSRNRSGI
jgi:hypothetical protein